MSADADRIAALESELAEAHENERRINREREALCTSLDQERAAHERTKAELAESEKEGEHALRQLDKALTDLEEAKRDVERLSGDRDRYRRDCVLAENLANGLRQDMAVIVADRDAAIAREQAAQAEAAAMRLLIGDCHCGLQAPDSAAGRTLAARVALLEAVDLAAAVVRDNAEINTSGTMYTVSAHRMQALIVALAAVDENGGGS